MMDPQENISSYEGHPDFLEDLQKSDAFDELEVTEALSGVDDDKKTQACFAFVDAYYSDGIDINNKTFKNPKSGQQYEIIHEEYWRFILAGLRQRKRLRNGRVKLAPKEDSDDSDKYDESFCIEGGEDDEKYGCLLS